MLYKAFTLAPGQDHLVHSKPVKCEIVDSFWFLKFFFFFLTANKDNLSIVMYYML